MFVIKIKLILRYHRKDNLIQIRKQNKYKNRKYYKMTEQNHIITNSKFNKYNNNLINNFNYQKQSSKKHNQSLIKL